MADNLLTDKEHNALAVAIVKAMNEGLPAKTWTIIDHETWTQVKGQNGDAFSLDFEGYGNQGKLKISGVYPCTNDGGYIGVPNDTPDPAIGVSLSRGAETIAKEIIRRFLPDYLPVLAMVQKIKQERDTRAAKLAANTKALVEAFEVTFPIERPDIHQNAMKHGHFHIGSHRCFSGEVRVSETTADLKLSSIPFATAHKIAALLMALPKRKQ